MARPRSPVTLAEEKVPCVSCGAAVGQRCVMNNGRPYPSYCHAQRFEAATQAGYLPLDRQGEVRPAPRRNDG